MPISLALFLVSSVTDYSQNYYASYIISAGLATVKRLMQHFHAVFEKNPKINSPNIPNLHTSKDVYNVHNVLLAATMNTTSVTSLTRRALIDQLAVGVADRSQRRVE